MHMRPRKFAAIQFQGCCGIFACLMAAGIKLKTAAELDSYRLLFKKQRLVRKNMRNWLGGTYDTERLAILRFLRLHVQQVRHKAKTLQKLLRERCIYQTKTQYIVTITGHCYYVRTNHRKTKLFCMDQRGKQMRIKSTDLQRDSYKRIESVLRVTPYSYCLRTGLCSGSFFKPFCNHAF